MTTQLDRDLAIKLLPNAATRTDEPSVVKMNAAIKDISRAMLPTRQALQDLVAVLNAVQTHPDFKSVWQSARDHQVTYDGPTWKAQLEAAQAVVNTFPVASPMGET